MRFAVGAAALAFCALAPASAVAQDTAVEDDAAVRLQLAQEIVSVGFPEDQREDLFFGAMDTMVKQMRDGMLVNMPKDPGAIAILNSWLDEWMDTGKGILSKHIPTLMAAQAEGYADIFTVAELQDIRAFVLTPSGQRFVQMSPKVMATPAFATANQAYIQEFSAELPAAREDLMQRLKEYFAEQ